MITTNQ
jgi:hypothetical protein